MRQIKLMNYVPPPTKTDVEKAKTSVPSDRTEILDVIKKRVGDAEFKMVVRSLMRNWTVDIVIAEIEDVKRDIVDDSSKKRQAEHPHNVIYLLLKI